MWGSRLGEEKPPVCLEPVFSLLSALCPFPSLRPTKPAATRVTHRSSTRFPPNAHSHAAESLAPGQESWGFTLYALSLFLPRARVHAHTRAHTRTRASL